VVDQSNEDISDCKGLRVVAMTTKFSVKWAEKVTKNGQNFRCKPHIHAKFGLQIAFGHSGNSPLTLPYTRYKGALPWQPILGQKVI